MAKDKKQWKDLGGLEKTQSSIDNKNQEITQEQSVDEFLSDEKLGESSTDRRDFLKVLGFGVAAATVAACEAPVTKVVPYVNKPVDITPGKPTWYASTYYDGNSYANILVKTREGRPIFIKGNKDFGFTNGATNPRILASVLSLYNESRLQWAFNKEDGIATVDADKKIKDSLEKIKSKKGKVVLVSNTIASPSTYKAIDEFSKSITGSAADKVKDAASAAEGDLAGAVNEASNGTTFEHIEYDAISYSGIRKANELSFGDAFIPDYDFTEAKTIVSFGADFLSTWLLATQFSNQYSKRRDPDGEWMSRHYQIESNMSITGSNADERMLMKPSEEAGILASLINEFGGSTGSVSAKVPEQIGKKNIAKIVKDLKKGNGLIVSGSNNTGIQVLVNKLNHLIRAYENIINVNNPIQLFASQDDEMMKLVADVIAGKGPDAIFFYGANPSYSLPNGKEFATALNKIQLSVSLSSFKDETASNCQYVVPNHHALESWNDFSPKANEYAIAQPTIRPLYDTVPAQESFLVWSGYAKERGGKNSNVFHDFIKKTWSEKGIEVEKDFESFWNKTVYKSVYSEDAAAPTVPQFKSPALNNVGKSLPKGGDLEVVFYQKAGIGNGDHAGNPWLQELPDPISKVTWDNYITMDLNVMNDKGYSTYIDQENPASIAELKVGDVTYTLPVLPSPGQAPGTVGLALGYGRGGNGEKIGNSAYQTKEYGGHVTNESGNPKPIGKNAFRMLHDTSGVIEYTAVGQLAKKAGGYPIAMTQTQRTVMGRNSIIRQTTLDVYNSHTKAAYNPDWTLKKINDKGEHVDAPLEDFDLWDEHPVEDVGHRWGMSIDLSSCIGCGNCLIACQSENNVPVVGKDEVRRGREMHWIRVDRYYSSEQETEVGQRKSKDSFDLDLAEVPSSNPTIVHQPMMCQHCNHAPCETVCPVSATTHSNEGLNQMTYNRCIGTRYCANNCPYKVRRFNWFNYPSYKKFGEVNPAQDDVGRMVLNPDVTVRTRGVMEKCSFCVQRVQATKLDAKKEQRAVADGDMKTACQDSCPTDAIVVGDWNNPESSIRKKSEKKLAYHALEELGTKPNVWYQTKVRNKDNELLAEIQAKEEATHNGSHHGHAEGEKH